MYSEKLMGPSYPELSSTTQSNKPKMAKLPREELYVVADDGVKLKGYLFKSETPTDKTVICIHGYKSYGFHDYATVGLEYLRRGYNVLLATNRACGDSEGKWTGFGVLECKDTLKWVEKMVSIYPAGDIYLHGCSLGGATVCMMSNLEMPTNVRAIVSDCAFADLNEELAHMMKYLAHLPTFPLLNLMNMWSKRLAGYAFSECSPILAVSQARYPMFFVHGNADRFIPADMGKRLYEACSCAQEDKRLLLIEGAGHAAANVLGKEKYFEPVVDFFKKYESNAAAD